MVFIAIANGVLRETTYGRRLDSLHAHQASTLAAILLFGVYISAVLSALRLESPAQAIRVGIFWVVLTVAFEFLFGHFVAGHPWSRLLADYDLLAGRVWLLVLLWIGSAPWLLLILRRRR